MIYLKVICIFTFISHAITVPIFILSAEKFQYSHIKPFGFTGLEVLPILLVIGVFLFLLLLFTLALSGQFKGYIKDIKLPLKVMQARNSLTPYLAILLIIIPFFFVNYWSFMNGISIVGLEPPKLPYRIVGITHYLTKYIIPLLIVYFYLKTKRPLFLTVTIVIYSFYVGMTGVTKVPLLLTVAPVLWLLFLERKVKTLVFICLLTIVFIHIITISREYVFVKDYIDLHGDVFDVLFLGLEGKVTDINFTTTLVGIFDRVDGFNNIVMSYYYDATGNILATLSKFVYPFIQMDMDLHHIQWQGGIPPEGFVNIGGMLSHVIILSNSNILLTLISALIIATILFIFERGVGYASYIFNFNEIFGKIIIIMFTLSYYAELSLTFNFWVWILFFILAIIARLNPYRNH